MVTFSLFNFIIYFVFSILAFFPLLFQEKGMSPTEIGMLMGVGTFISVLAQPFWGYIADKKRTTKGIMLLLSGCALIISGAIFFFDSFVLLFLTLILFFFFFSPIQPLADSLATSYTMDHNKNYGAVRMWGSIGYAIASYAVGAFAENAGVGKLGYVMAAFFIIAMLVTTKLEDSSTERDPISKEMILKAVKNKEYLFFLFIVLLISIPFSMNNSIFSLYMKELGAGETEIGLALMVAAFSEVPMIFLTGKLLNKYTHLQLISFAGFVFFVRWFLFGMTDSVSVIIVLQLLQSLSFSIFIVAAIQYVARLVQREMLATGQTVYFAVQSGVAGIIGSSLGGLLMDMLNASTAYIIGSFIVLAGTALAFSMHKSIQKKNEAYKLAKHEVK